VTTKDDGRHSSFVFRHSSFVIRLGNASVFDLKGNAPRSSPVLIRYKSCGMIAIVATHGTMVMCQRRLAGEERSMDLPTTRPLSEILTTPIPEADTFDLTAFDTLPSRSRTPLREQPPIILVIDDEPDVGKLVRRLLQSRLPQYDIIVATHPAEAIQRIQGRVVALMIADFNMPDMNGIALAAQVKARAPHIQVLLITGYTTAILEQLVEQRHIDYFLPKPFLLSDMERLVVRALGVHMALEQLPDGDESE
jgi:CheY-like chemotaxis protein